MQPYSMHKNTGSIVQNCDIKLHLMKLHHRLAQQQGRA